MDYKEKYEQSLERARELSKTVTGANYEYIFPELKESEDQRIRKGLIKAVSGILKGNTLYGTDVTREEAIAWLEKQGEQKKVSIWKHWKNGIAGNGEGRQVYLIRTGNTYDLSSCLGFECDYIELSELDNLMLEKQGEKKPADKPKFKIGDFIVNDYCKGKIIELTNDAYLLDTGQGIPFSCEHNIHLWNIQDAEDGDVLVCNINKAEIGGDVEKLPNITPTICIYQNVVKDHDYIHSYCSLYNRSSLRLQNAMYYNTFVYYIHPATKEERDLLFTKMKEAGYEWDSEKKELKKIESKTLDADDILPYLGNNQVQDILEDMGMLDDNGHCPHTAEEIFKAGMEHAFNLNREAASSVKLDAKNK